MWYKVLIFFVILILICLVINGGCNWLIGPCDTPQAAPPRAAIVGPCFVRTGTLQKFVRTQDCRGDAYAWFFVPPTTAECYVHADGGLVFASRRPGVYMLGLMAVSADGAKADVDTLVFYNGDEPLPPETVIDLSGKLTSGSLP